MEKGVASYMAAATLLRFAVVLYSAYKVDKSNGKGDRLSQTAHVGEEKC
jgi:hypothetical protein